MRCLGSGRDAEEGSDEDSSVGRHSEDKQQGTQREQTKTHRTQGGPGDTLFLRLVHTQSKTTSSSAVRNKP